MAAAVSCMLVIIAGLTLIAGPLAAQTIYPIDRAAVLAGARFDFKVEFPVIEKEADLKITINGEDYSRQFGKAGQFVENEDGLNASSLVLRDASIDKPGGKLYQLTIGNMLSADTAGTLRAGIHREIAYVYEHREMTPAQLGDRVRQTCGNPESSNAPPG